MDWSIKLLNYFMKKNLNSHYKVFALLLIVFFTELLFAGGLLPIKSSMDQATLVHISGFFELLIIALSLINYALYVLKFIGMKKYSQLTSNIGLVVFTIINFLAVKVFIMASFIALFY